MHQTRSDLTSKIPIPRKGTKYIARARGHRNSGVPVVVAVRDMLKLARTAREVKEMIKREIIKINNRVVRDYREVVCLFGILEAGKSYRLTLLETGRFSFEENKGDTKLGKIINKQLIAPNTYQLNLHDGTNIVSKENAKVGDSVELDMKNKVKKMIKIEKGKEVFVISGRSMGHKGKVIETENGEVVVQIRGKNVNLDRSNVVAI